jgi:hypothetical protein
VENLKFMGDSQQPLASFPELAKREAGDICGQASRRGVCAALFLKTTPKTARPDIELAAKRYKLIGVQHGKKQEGP